MLFAKMLLAVLVFLPVSDEGLDQLIKDVKSEDAKVRGKAMLAIGPMLGTVEDEQQQKQIAEILIDAIADSNSLVNHSARLRIAEHPAIVNKYLKPYFDSDEGFPSLGKACETIKVVGAEARVWLPDLIKCLDRDERSFRLAALHAMGALDGVDLLPALDKTIKELDNKDFNIQLSACRVLSKIGPKAKKAGPRLVKLLEEGIVSSRTWAGIALGAIGPHEEYDVVELLKERLGRFYLVDRERALTGLALLGEHAKPTLPEIEKLMENRSKSVQHTASRAHWKISGDPAKAIERLITLIPTMEFGVDAMDILSEMGAEAKSAVPKLIEQLNSPEFPTREAAVYALASIGSEAKVAIESLKELDSTEQDQLVKAAIVIALKKIQTPEDERVKDKVLSDK